MKEELAAALAEAEVAEREGDLEKAHGILRRISTDYSELLATRSILWPLQVTSEPSGATLSVSGNEIGKTPLILRFKPGTTVTLNGFPYKQTSGQMRAEQVTVNGKTVSMLPNPPGR